MKIISRTSGRKRTGYAVSSGSGYVVFNCRPEQTEIPVKEAKRSNETKIKLVKKAEKKEVEELLSSRHDRVRKVKESTYNVLPRGPVYKAILKKKITKKEDIGGNFEIPLSIGGLKHVNALVDQGSNGRKSKASPGMGRKDKASLGKGDEVQPIEEQKF
ncbi:hypothetical protein Tco_1174085 [Tanacetum coccineum]